MPFLLGFDARDRGVPSRQRWTVEDREAFLYRLDVEPPLTVDNSGGCSLFDQYEDSIPVPKDTEETHFWNNLDYLEQQLTKIPSSHPPYKVVAIALVNEELNAKEKHEFEQYLQWVEAVLSIAGYPGWPRFPTWVNGMSVPDVIDSEWSCLGYDIADLGLTSGLTNCSIEEGKAVELRSRWGPFLNQYHLFEDLSQAQAFKDYCNQSVPEHAPFFVYGLWLIREVEGTENMPNIASKD